MQDFEIFRSSKPALSLNSTFDDLCLASHLIFITGCPSIRLHTVLLCIVPCSRFLYSSVFVLCLSLANV
jgi:hypothetical protein